MTMRWIFGLGVGLVVLCAGTALVLVPRREHPEPREAQQRTSSPPADLKHALQAADPARGANLFARCAACHSIGRDAVDLDGPNLYGVVGSPVAARRPRYAYTAALRNVGGSWTVDRLDAWLKAPAAFAPGTKMAFDGLPDLQDRADLIAFLNTQGSKLPLP